jgi:hypothetical protein
MRKMMRVWLFLGGVVLLCWGDVQACGDKFLVVGRGIRYKGKSAHPASILMYMNPASRLPAAAKDVQLQAGLKQAGHKVQTVDDASALGAALESARFDLVLADISDSAGLEKRVASSPSKPVVVPVLYKATKEEMAAAKSQYGCALQAPSKDPLAAIDEAMLQKLKGTEAKATKAR